MNGTDFVIAMVGVAIAALSFAFTVWARNVKAGKDSLDKMSDSIREIVELRLRQIGEDVHVMRKDMHKVAELVQMHEVKLAQHEILIERNGKKGGEE